MNGQHI